jgi:hypothetical protein
VTGANRESGQCRQADKYSSSLCCRQHYLCVTLLVSEFALGVRTV